jgi:hypothetical protein
MPVTHVPPAGFTWRLSPSVPTPRNVRPLPLEGWPRVSASSPFPRPWSNCPMASIEQLWSVCCHSRWKREEEYSRGAAVTLNEPGADEADPSGCGDNEASEVFGTTVTTSAAANEVVRLCGDLRPSAAIHRHLLQ